MPVWNTERNNAAKDALRAELNGGRWTSHADVIKAMERGSDLAPRTCANVLRELVKDWGLQQKGYYKAGGRYATDTREYRAPNPQSLDRGRELAAQFDRDIKKARNKLDHHNAQLQATVAKIVTLKEEIDEMEKMKALMLKPLGES